MNKIKLAKLFIKLRPLIKILVNIIVVILCFIWFFYDKDQVESIIVGIIAILNILDFILFWVEKRCVEIVDSRIRMLDRN